MITILETVRSLWSAGLNRVEAERKSKNLSTEQYFASLELVVESIKEFLRKHEFLKKGEFTVKHGETTMVVIVDLPNIKVIRDPVDPERPLFHIPAEPKKEP